MPHPRLRGTEQPGMIHLPAVGPVPHQQIDCFVAGGGGNYTWVYLKGETRPRLLSEALGYFASRLPEFVREGRSRLCNPLLMSADVTI